MHLLIYLVSYSCLLRWCCCQSASENKSLVLQGELSTAESCQIKTSRPEHPWARCVCYCKPLRCGGCLLTQQKLTSTCLLTEHLFSADTILSIHVRSLTFDLHINHEGSVSSSVPYCKHQKITLAVYKEYKRKTSASSQREQQRLDVFMPKELKRIWNI